MMVKTGLFFGSFNPIHIGHLAIANYIVEYADIDQLWFVVSPHNPLKEKKSLLADHQRLEMTRLAIDDDDRFWVSDIEFNMPRPSYTIDTLTYLVEKYPDRQFFLIMGADGLATFYKWKNAELIENNFQRLVYPRPGIPDSDYETHKNITRINAPLMDISSSFIRKAIQEGKNIKYFLPSETYNYLMEMHFYE